VSGTCLSSGASRWQRSYAAIVKVRHVLRMLEDDGWSVVATRGSHRQLRHPAKQGASRCGRPADDLAPDTLSSILKQAMLERR
jgi:predicted RNA binding protein YcfA (HicA-like mRNA interferase family)